MSTQKFDPDYELELTQISAALKNQVSPIAIHNWLCQFDERKHHYAIRLLKQVQFYTSSDIVEIYKTSLDSLYEVFPDSNFIVFPSTIEPGKSGHAMTYFLRKAIQSSQRKYQKRFQFRYSHDLVLGENARQTVPIILDDFSGSGTTVNDCIKLLRTSRSIHWSIEDLIVFTAFYTARSKYRILKSNPKLRIKIFGQNITPAFSTGVRLFGKETTHIREFAYSEGVKIYKKHPLGFKNSQSLVVFEHATPNNTIPILWFSNDNFKGLFPRLTRPRLGQAKQVRDDAARLLYLSGLSERYGKNIRVKDDDVIYMVLLKYLVGKRSVLYLCQILGLLESDLKARLNQMKEKGFLEFEPEGFPVNSQIQITSKGLTFYSEVKRLAQKSASTSFLASRSKKLYLPDTFGGAS